MPAICQEEVIIESGGCEPAGGYSKIILNGVILK